MLQRELPPHLVAYVKEHATWDALATAIAANDDVPSDVRNAAASLVPDLAVELGSEWPVDIFARKHPCAQVFGDISPHWTVAFVEDAQDVLTLRDLRRWPRLRQRFKRPGDDAVRALAEIRVAARALRLGAKVELDPRTDHDRRADVRIVTPVADVTVEVCIAQPIPPIAFEASAIVDRLIPRFAIADANVAVGGEIVAAPPDDELDACIQAFARARHEASEANSAQHLVLPGVADVWMVRFDHPHYQQMVDDGRIGKLGGPTFAWSPLRKLHELILDKATQLPAERAGLLVLTPPSFLGQPPAAPDLARFLQETLRTIPHVCAIGLVSRLLSTEPDQEQPVDPRTTLWQSKVFGPVAERTMFVRSPLAVDDDVVGLCASLLRRDLRDWT